MSANVVLGLGSNEGCRLSHLRAAINALNNKADISIKKTSSVYQSKALLKEDAPSTWQKDFLNVAVLCQTTLSPRELLDVIKNIENDLGRQDKGRWSPRVIDIDILCWGDESYQDDKLTIPHPALCERPFALWPLLDVLPDWQPSDKPLPSFAEDSLDTHLSYQRIKPPHLMAILNVSPESFSHDAIPITNETIEKFIIHAIDQGAELIDIGAVATNPHSKELGHEIEWQRLSQALDIAYQVIDKHDFVIKPHISVDTYQLETAKKVLAQYPVNIINDVSGRLLDDIAELLKERASRYVFMHQMTIRPNSSVRMQGDPITKLNTLIEKQLRLADKHKLNHDALIFDPGLGFSKSYQQTKAICKALPELKQHGLDILVGHSRKTFMPALKSIPRQERDLETAILSLLLASQSVDYLRVHDVATTARALNVSDWWEN